MKGDAVNAQSMDRRIRIERQTVTRDAYGGETFTYALRAEVSASVFHVRGREAFTGQQVTSAADVEFRLRWRPDVEQTDRIVFDGQAYDIVYIAEQGRRRQLRLLAKMPGAEPT